jgi:small subunit ribosomal protein S4
MTKRIAQKHKIDRRLSVNLWGRPKSPFNLRKYRPGQHGQKHTGKLSDYGVQLHAKQKLKGYYGNISEKQFRRYYDKALKKRGDTSEYLIALLETRLDAIIYRMNIAPTVFASRQLINHGHIEVNNRRVTIPSFSVTTKDIIGVRQKSLQHPVVLETTDKAAKDIPDYIEFDKQKIVGRLIRVPKLSDVPYPVQMEPNLVVEFYSR